MSKYNIYIICKDEQIFMEKSKIINSKYKKKICHIQWIPAEYLKLTQCNKKILKDLNTRYNTQKKKILAKPIKYRINSKFDNNIRQCKPRKHKEYK